MPCASLTRVAWTLDSTFACLLLLIPMTPAVFLAQLLRWIKLAFVWRGWWRWCRRAILAEETPVRCLATTMCLGVANVDDRACSGGWGGTLNFATCGALRRRRHASGFACRVRWEWTSLIINDAAKECLVHFAGVIVWQDGWRLRWHRLVVVLRNHGTSQAAVHCTQDHNE